MVDLNLLSEKARKGLETLVDVGQEAWDNRYGEWPELEEALRIWSPIVYPDFDINDFLEGGKPEK